MSASAASRRAMLFFFWGALTVGVGKSVQATGRAVGASVGVLGFPLLNEDGGGLIEPLGILAQGFEIRQSLVAPAIGGWIAQRLKQAPHFRQFTHGYASTSHSAQSKTVDHGLVLGEKGCQAANLQQAYMSNSRFSQTQTFFTTDKEQAFAAMARFEERHLALEVMKELALRTKRQKNVDEIRYTGATEAFRNS